MKIKLRTNKNSRWATTIIKQKDIKINGKRINQNVDIYLNDEILIYISDEYLDPSFNLNVFFEDENILIINKPSNLEVTGQTV